MYCDYALTQPYAHANEMLATRREKTVGKGHALRHRLLVLNNG